jgi:hypothetical protein
MGFFVVAIRKSKLIDFVAAVSDAFGKGDVRVLDQSVEFFIVELVQFVEISDGLSINEPYALVHGVFDTIGGHPATASGIENTKRKNEA